MTVQDLVERRPCGFVLQFGCANLHRRNEQVADLREGLPAEVVGCDTFLPATDVVAALEESLPALTLGLVFSEIPVHEQDLSRVSSVATHIFFSRGLIRLQAVCWHEYPHGPP